MSEIQSHLPQHLPVDTSDAYFLRLAFELKSKVPKPPQSHFRVFAILTYRDDSVPTDMISIVTGVNSECCHIGNSICAERSALVQLRQKPGARVDKVYLVCDSQAYITPGVLCREYMIDNFCNENTLIITSGENQVPSVFTLGQLYPYPSVFLNKDREHVLPFAKQFAVESEQFITKFSNHASWIRLYSQTVTVASKDRPVYLHPIFYVAGVLFSDGHIIVIPHHEGIEYGCTVDPISRLAPFIERYHNAEPELLLQVDQFGILHTPNSVARSYIHEKGYHNLKLVVHDRNGKLHLIMGSELVPHGPKSVDLVKYSSKL
jgi:cytidine deaminase